MRTELQARADAKGTVKPALQDDYRLLELLGDPLGRAFREHGMPHDATKGSPLAARNQSILAHGFQPVSRNTYEALLRPTVALLLEAGIAEGKIPRFPQSNAAD